MKTSKIWLAFLLLFATLGIFNCGSDPIKCVYNNECPDGQKCLAIGVCGVECQVDRDCNPGYTCQEGQCLEVIDGSVIFPDGGPAHDGGIADGGIHDGGAPDSGIPADGGTDGGLYGYLNVTTTPRNAEIFIDDQDTGEETPHLFHLPVGTYQVKVTMDGYQTKSDDVYIVHGQNTVLHFDLIPVADGGVDGGPWLDGGADGGPANDGGPNSDGGSLDGSMIADGGIHDGGLPADGGPTNDGGIDGSVPPSDGGIADGGPQFGTLVVTSNPEGAKIGLDNAWTANLTPYTFPTLAAGQYNVAVLLEGYQPKTSLVLVLANATTTVPFVLEPNDGGVDGGPTPDGGPANDGGINDGGPTLDGGFDGGLQPGYLNIHAYYCLNTNMYGNPDPNTEQSYTISLDGVTLQQQTPANITLSPGQHTATLVDLPGDRMDYVHTVEITAGHTTQLAIQLTLRHNGPWICCNSTQPTCGPNNCADCSWDPRLLHLAINTCPGWMRNLDPRAIDHWCLYGATCEAVIIDGCNYSAPVHPTDGYYCHGNLTSPDPWAKSAQINKYVPNPQADGGWDNYSFHYCY